MALTTLKDDLLQEFREERIMINEQIELLDPLATSLRKPAAIRLLSSGTLIITEISCYIISLGGVAFIAFMHLIYPFSIMGDIFYNSEVRNKTGDLNLLYFILAVYGITALGVLLIFVIGRMAREIRLKNDILHIAGKDIKTIIGQHLERKAAHETIEQRHMLGVSGISLPPAKQKSQINEVKNPAYEPEPVFNTPALANI
jgi:uncharacterized membrane protein